MSQTTKHQAAAIRSYVPEAMGHITHDVTYDLPKERGMAVMSESLPCRSEKEANGVARNKRAAGMKNVRVVDRAVQELQYGHAPAPATGLAGYESDEEYAKNGGPAAQAWTLSQGRSR